MSGRLPTKATSSEKNRTVLTVIITISITKSKVPFFFTKSESLCSVHHPKSSNRLSSLCSSPQWWDSASQTLFVEGDPHACVWLQELQNPLSLFIWIFSHPPSWLVFSVTPPRPRQGWRRCLQIHCKHFLSDQQLKQSQTWKASTVSQVTIRENKKKLKEMYLPFSSCICIYSKC